MFLPRLLATGSARSGASYLAGLLTSLGSPCGHEAAFAPEHLFGPDGEPLGAADVRAWPRSFSGEASWLAAPYVDAMPRGTFVLHLVREPIAVLRSLVRTGLIERPGPAREWAERHLPALARGGGDALERAMRYWVGWNRLVEEGARRGGVTSLRLRVEELDTEHVADLLGRIDVERPGGWIAAQLRHRPSEVWAYGPRVADEAVRFDTLPAGALRDELAERARAYGYGAPTEAGTLVA